MLLRVLFFLILMSAVFRRIWNWTRTSNEPLSLRYSRPGQGYVPVRLRSRMTSLTDQAIEDAEYEELP